MSETVNETVAVGSSGGDASSKTVVESIFEMHTKALGS
jgi:hypothetical protein